MNPDLSARAELFDFPCPFPLKIMGAKHEDFSITIIEVIRQHAPDFQAHEAQIRESKGGNYLAMTATITAVSREQLDALYLALTGHPMVKVVL